MIYEKVKVKIVPFNEETIKSVTYIDQSPSVEDILVFLSGRPLRDQIYMLCNLFTISGFTQSEIADVLNVNWQTYKNRLHNVRKTLDDKSLLF